MLDLLILLLPPVLTILSVSPMMAHDEERRFTEKQYCFLGSAKVHLKHLNFDVYESQSTSLTLDTRNIDRLIQVFKLEGCLRLDLEPHIPAIISQETFQKSLAHSKVDNTALLFPEHIHLSCLHGKHRIAAAKTLLLPGDTWWIVDLYQDGQ